MPRNDGKDYTVARNSDLLGNKVEVAQGHNERENDTYSNPDIIPERTAFDVFAASDLPAKAVILAENWDKLQENDEWLNYYRWFTTWNPYGSVDNMPQEDQGIIREAFQEHVKKQQEVSLLNPVKSSIKRPPCSSKRFIPAKLLEL